MDRPCPHRHLGLDPTLDLSKALDRGQRRCEAAGERWTAPRHRTYELLLAAPGAVKAYDLIRRFGPNARAAKPPTGYRSLDLLMALGLVH